MTEVQPTRISRRTVAKGAAWTAPVILGGIAAPAYAASGNKPTISPGPSCKQPGNSCNPIVKGYVFTFTITNTSNKTVYLYTGGTYPTYGPSVSSGGVLPLTYAGAKVGGTFYAPGQHIPIPAGASVQLLLSAGSSNSSDEVFTFTVRFQWGHTPNPANDTEHTGDPLVSTVNVAGTPPCVNCAPPANPTAAIAAAKAEEDKASSSTTPSSSPTTSTPSTATLSPTSTPSSAPQSTPTATTAP